MFSRQARGDTSYISTPKWRIRFCIIVLLRAFSWIKGKVHPISGVLLVVFVKCSAWRFTPRVSERSKSIFRSAILFHVSYVLVFFVISERV
jgi:hypothetical protein